MGLVEVSMNFLEASVLVAEMATFAVWAELLSVELPAVLGLVLLVKAGLSLGDPVDLGELVVAGAPRRLAAASVSTGSGSPASQPDMICCCTVGCRADSPNEQVYSSESLQFSS